MKIISFIILSALISSAANAQVKYEDKSAGSITKTLKTDNMNYSALQTVNEFLQAVKKGDMGTVGSLLHPDVSWSQPGNSIISGEKGSVKEVFEMVQTMFKQSANTLQLTDIKVLAVNGNQVACLVHWLAGQPGGKVLDVDNIDVYTVKDGKIVKVMIFSADTEAEDNFWGKN
ncbi:MAG TPA: nuclear transport factor 2 family protein [Chitinophagaceae bacterium]